ncbi:MAG: alpha/beta hydrolase [Proteobacteria bacterium]|nr:alpha/beta hydrolase [Pseudomonadota bacterium]
MKRVKGDGVEMQLAVWERMAETILCVHGISANCRCWDTMAEALAPRYQIIAMDLRGRGLSEKPPAGYSIAHHCQDIRVLLENLGVERAVIMGHSLGALIAIAFGAQYPEKVESLILVDGGGKLSAEQTEKVFAGIQPTLDRLGKVFPSSEAYLDLMKKNPLLQPWSPALETYYLYEIEEVDGGVRSRVQPEHIKEEAENLGNLNVAEFYPQIKCPVLILRATEGMLAPDDILLPKKVVERMLQEIPDARCVDLQGSNHYSIVLQPNDARDQAIRYFLEE